MSDKTERAVLAGGCFWGVQDLLRKQPGVISTRVGYSGGDVPNATYRNHGTHAEAIEIVFDPDRLSFRELLEFFFQIHDPTTRNRQGNDVGTSYRSAIYTERRAEAHRAGHDRGRRGLGPVARPRRHGSRPCRPLLGGRARAPGLPRAHSQRLYVPLRPAAVAVARARQERQGQLIGKGRDPSYNRFRRRPICTRIALRDTAHRPRRALGALRSGRGHEHSFVAMQATVALQ